MACRDPFLGGSGRCRPRATRRAAVLLLGWLLPGCSAGSPPAEPGRAGAQLATEAVVDGAAVLSVTDQAGDGRTVAVEMVALGSPGYVLTRSGRVVPTCWVEPRSTVASERRQWACDWFVG